MPKSVERMWNGVAGSTSAAIGREASSAPALPAENVGDPLAKMSDGDPPDPPDPPDPRLLSTKNPHVNDGRVTFEEEGHKYMHVASGRRVPKSQTAALEDFDTFDANRIIETCWKKWRSNDTSKYWALIHYLELVKRADEAEIKTAIAELWQANGNRAASEGTKMHAQLEDYLNGLIPNLAAVNPPPMGVALYLGMMNWFYPEQQLQPWRVEFSVCVETTIERGGKHPDAVMPCICGNIDAIFRSKKDGRYWILDWKRVDPKKKGLLGKKTVQQTMMGKRFRGEDMATGHFSEWEATNYNKYSAQLHGYRWQLIEGGYMQAEEIAGCFLVQMHEDLEHAHVIEAADMQQEVDTMMRAEVDAAREAWFKELEPTEEELPDRVDWSIQC